MDKIIKYVVSCDTLYGVIALAILFIGLATLGYIAYKITQLVLEHIYKIVCKCCNTSKKYDNVHTKLGVKDFSFENDFHQSDTALQ